MVEGTQLDTLMERDGRDLDWARELVELSWAYRAARVVQVAHRVGLFERLGTLGATAAAAADQDLDAAMVEKLLIACAAMDLAARDGERWVLTPKARATLLPGAPRYQGNAIAHAASVWGFWNGLEAVVRGRRDGQAGTPAVQETARRRSHRDFILAMHNMATADRAAELVLRVDLSGKRTLLDVGGGPGTYSLALCRRYPDLRATVFDLPETLALAREVIERFGLSDRVGTREGNWDTDEFGSGNDAVILSNVLHGPGKRAEMKLAKAHRSMSPGGVLIVQDFLLNPEKNGPLRPALFNIMVGAFSTEELRERLAAAGFSQIEQHDLSEDYGTTVITATK